jgi:alpha(1,3/1,4) fucosyltransferase
MAPINVCAINFWPTFSLKAGFVNYLLNRAFDAFNIVDNEQDADIVISSVFVKKLPLDPERTICFIWENMRPDYRLCRYSISSDFDSYGRRNCRVPLWYAELLWPGYLPDQTVPGSRNHGFELPVEIEPLLHPRPVRSDRSEDLFCCYVADNPELHRQFCVECLSRVGRVDMYGNIVNRPFRSSKYDLLRRYRFNLCFENSIFPGYYTEKALHAWAGGCVPLYYSDNWYSFDFNPKAIINRIHFSSLDEFAEHVALVNKSQSALNKIFEQPLLSRRPTLDPAIDFLRKACDHIRRDSRRRSTERNASDSSGRPNVDMISQSTGRDPGRNEKCPCGSGKKYKHCHGRLISGS